MTDLLHFSSTATQLVPASFAEKAMASLMQLHSELMDEKERRVELHRRLMEREQALAELKMYVKLLEERQPAAHSVRTDGSTGSPQGPVEAPARTHAETPPPPLPRRPAPTPVQVGVRTRPEGWKVW